MESRARNLPSHSYSVRRTRVSFLSEEAEPRPRTRPGNSLGVCKRKDGSDQQLHEWKERRSSDNRRQV